MNNTVSIGNVASSLVGIVVMAIGIVNTFWGNDPGFGIFIVLLSFGYYPPANEVFSRVTGFSIPLAVKVVLALFILWAALGVGELFDKIELMKASF